MTEPHRCQYFDAYNFKTQEDYQSFMNSENGLTKFRLADLIIVNDTVVKNRHGTIQSHPIPVKHPAERASA